MDPQVKPKSKIIDARTTITGEQQPNQPSYLLECAQQLGRCLTGASGAHPLDSALFLFSRSGFTIEDFEKVDLNLKDARARLLEGMK